MASATISAKETPKSRGSWLSWATLGVLLVVLLWSYWNSLTEASVYWQGAQYSHGFLVPLFTVFLLWLRRKGSADAPIMENAGEKAILAIGGLLLVGAAAICWMLPESIVPETADMLKLLVGGPLFATGTLVIGISAVAIWLQGQKPREIHGWERWCGVALLSVGLGCRLTCAHIGLDIPDMYTFVFCVAGAILLAGGWPLFRWAGPSSLFLIFMFPLPWSVERMLLAPLQSLATQASTFALQTLGVEAYNGGGNRICIEELQLGVIDQCSGLRMTTIFLALSVGMVLLVRRAWWENVVILLSAIPIALTVNVARITVTGILYLVASSELAEHVFHDWAGYLMMPLALGLLWLELVVLSRLFVEVDDAIPIPMAAQWQKAQRPRPKV